MIKDKWSKLTIFYKTALFLFILALIAMIIGLILIAAPTATIGGESQNGFDVLRTTGVIDIWKMSAPSPWTASAWLEIQIGIGFAIVITPVLLIAMLITFLLGMFAIGTKKESKGK